MHDHAPAEEIPLEGGRLTAGIVRLGDTVRRPVKRASACTEQLLTYLEAQHFEGTPRFLGSDERDREIFSFIPGSVPQTWQRFADSQVAAAAQLLRRFHDLTRSSRVAGAHDVACHNDAGPNNFVFQDGNPVALIDFDLAAPGTVLEDIGYFAWAWCIASKASRGTALEQAAQLRVLADAYGLSVEQRSGLLRAAVKRQERNAVLWRGYLGRASAAMGATEEKIQDAPDRSKFAFYGARVPVGTIGPPCQASTAKRWRMLSRC